MVEFSMAGVARFMMCIMLIAALGYMLGRITIKGVSLGTAGVFIVALIFGAMSDAVTLNGEPILSFGAADLQWFKAVEQLGLVLFVAAVGFIAGPTFFANFKKNFKSYILLGLVIILSGGLAAVACFYLGKFTGGIGSYSDVEFASMITGLLSGALTSTPAFSAAKETVGAVEEIVSAGYGIAYLFGVIGVVLFVQLIPKLTRANMEEERKKITGVDTGSDKKGYKGKLLEMDDFGFTPFALASVLGLLVGAINIGGFFSLGTTGGVLIVSLVFGFVSHLGPISLIPSEKALKVFREFGLMLFLIGAGIPGGINFIENVKGIYFVYGMIMTIVPMILGFLFAKYALKLSLFNNLGSITGGMTSTPALGTLIHASGTEDVASAYAATYPIALIAVVLVSRCLFLLA